MSKTSETSGEHKEGNGWSHDWKMTVALLSGLAVTAGCDNISSSVKSLTGDSAIVVRDKDGKIMTQEQIAAEKAANYKAFEVRTEEAITKNEELLAALIANPPEDAEGKREAKAFCEGLKGGCCVDNLCPDYVGASGKTNTARLAAMKTSAEALLRTLDEPTITQVSGVSESDKKE